MSAHRTRTGDPRGKQYDYCLSCGADLSVMQHLDWCTPEYRTNEKVSSNGDDSWLDDAMQRIEHGDSEVHLARASEIPAEDVEYLEEDLIPLRVVTLVTGLDGVGKSSILYNKAAQLTRGKLPGKFKGRPADVVIASCEDHPASVIVPRLTAAGADLDRVYIVKVRRDGLEGDIALPDDLDAVALEVANVDARLLIVDPLVGHMPLHVDSHKAQHVRSVLAPLGRLAEERELAVAAVVHFNGAASTDVRTRISGSKALRDAARSVIVCGEDPSDESRYVMVQDKFSFGPKPTTGRAYKLETRMVESAGKALKTSGVVWLGEVEVDSRGLLAGPGDPEERTDVDEAEQILDKLLAEGGGRVEVNEAKKAAAAAGVTSDKTLQRARRRMGLEPDQEGFGSSKKWWWITPSLSGHASVDTGGCPESETLTPQGKEATESPSVDTPAVVSREGPDGSRDEPGPTDPRRFTR